MNPTPATTDPPDITNIIISKRRAAAEGLYQCPSCSSQLTQFTLWKHIKGHHGDEPIAHAAAKERKELEITWLISISSTPQQGWRASKHQASEFTPLASKLEVQSTVASPPADALGDLSLARDDRVMDDAPLIPSVMTPISTAAPTRKRVNRSERKAEKGHQPQPSDDQPRGPPSMPLFDPSHASSKKPIDNQPQRRATIDSSGRENKRPGKFQQPRNVAPGVVDTAPPPTILKHQPGKDVAVTSPSFSRQREKDYDEMVEEVIKMIKQPETRPISQDQLVAEVKAIYAGLVLVEAKCIEVDTKQSQLTNRVESDRTIVAPRLNNEQWQALIALHRTLLHEHHDFLLASQHPSASSSLRKLASKYAMPARMWRHGIHSFLELLRHRLPASFEHMLTFIYLAYSMMALLYETIPAFADTWVECLGDLSRYRMAIEEADPRDREVWTNVSRSWYTKGTDRTPLVGRLYHHLAILARPNYLQQLFYYSKSLIVGTPFLSARESMIAMFDPSGIRTQQTGGDASQAIDIAFLNTHSLLFQAINADTYEDVKANYHDMLDKRIGELNSAFKIQGVYVAVCNIAGIWQYGSKTGLMKSLCKDQDEAKADVAGSTEMDTTPDAGPDANIPIHLYTEGSSAEIALQNSIDFTMKTLELILDRGDDPNCHPHILVFLVLLVYLIPYQMAMSRITAYVPWTALVDAMNVLMAKKDEKDRQRILNTEAFPVSERERSIGRPLAEDFLLRGLDITKGYYPAHYFLSAPVDEEERSQELPSFAIVREDRMLWLFHRFAKGSRLINFDQDSKLFTVSLDLEDSLKLYKAAVRRLARTSVVSKEDPDVEMESAPPLEEEDSYDEGVNDNTELGQLLAQRNALRKQLHEPQISEAEQEISKKSSQALGPKSFKCNYTTVVVDTNSLVKNLDVFINIVLHNSFTIVVPYSVLTELNGLKSNEGAVAQTAQAATQFLEQALAEKKNIRVITAKGNTVTDIRANYKELIDSYRTAEGDGRQNLDDIIINTAKEQGELVIQKLGAQEDKNIKPVVLITDDTIMRVKGVTRGVACVSTKAWIKIMSRSEEGPSSKRKLDKNFQNLKSRFPKYDDETLREALREADGNELSAREILQQGKINISHHKRFKSSPDRDPSQITQ